MNLSPDPFGTAVMDFSEGKHDPVIQVSSNLGEDIETIPVPYLFRSWEEMPEKEKFALSLTKGHILDVGAGAGSHALALQQQDKDVTALDRSALCCKTMQARGVNNVIQQNFFQLEESEQYDTLLFMMNGFGLAGTLNGLEYFFQKCKKLLKPGGRIIGESADIIYMFEDEEEEGAYLIDLNGDYYGEVSYQMHYKGLTSEVFPWLYVSLDLLTEAAEKVGFSLLDHYEGEENDFMACFVLN
ncbi:MAG TPA: class I SAM-dependent methyltransferase [Cytophagaceae bacterium]|nr:class I SAM-dependent methyltransferase [Cytophagaceae bacterium]